jgi:predicted ribosome quality control (RQC) complex YloA/Tae2 family protein
MRKGRSPRKGTTKTLIYFGSRLFKRLHEHSQGSGLTKSEICRRALKEYFKTHKLEDIQQKRKNEEIRSEIEKLKKKITELESQLK